MPLLRNGAFVDDDFIALGDGEPAPAEGGILVSWARLARDFDALQPRAASLGVIFPADGEPAALTPYLGALAVIALPFARFTDGRAFSLARILRARLRFTGELRAIGDLLPDQLAHLRQVGFDAFLVPEGRASLDSWQHAATAMSLTYQTGYVPGRGYSPAEIFELRKRRA